MIGFLFQQSIAPFIKQASLPALLFLFSVAQVDGCAHLLELEQGGALSKEDYQELSYAGTERSSAKESSRTASGRSSVEPDPCEHLLESPPRGLSCLQCAHPNAREQAELITDILLRSCLRQPAINFLVDGTFSRDDEFLKSLIERLNSGGREAHLVFYALNGATQRRWQQTPIEALGTQDSPSVFRTRLHTDAEIREQVRLHFRSLLPLLSHAVGRAKQVYLVLALEDNYDDSSFEELLQLVLKELPPGLPLNLVRNPCPGCFSGNGAGIPAGILEERHTLSPFAVPVDGICSNDGQSYRFAHEGEGQGTLLSELGPLQRTSGERNSVFLLWNQRYQGLSDGPKRLHPDERQYPLPSPQEQSTLVHFLRSGLI